MRGRAFGALCAFVLLAGPTWLPPVGAQPVPSDCEVRPDPGEGSTTVLPPTGGQGTNVTTDGDEQYARVAANRTYYVAQAQDGEVAVYGRRDGATNLGEPPRAVAFDVSSDGEACVTSPALAGIADGLTVPEEPGDPGSVDGDISDWVGTSPLIAGQAVTSAGEFIYQDYIYDDTGAWATGRNTNGGRGFATPYGSYRYPGNFPRYRSNAADIFQFRAKLVDDRVHFLVWLNTLIEPDTTVVGIAVGGTGGTLRDWGLNSRLATPGTEHVITLFGTGGLIDGAPSDDLEVAVDTEANAIEASVPASLTGTSFRAYVASGLWDPAAEAWHEVGTARTPTSSSGGDGTSPNVFNVAFRWDENELEIGPRYQDLNFWFEYGQATALQEADIGAYHADIDLTAPDTPPAPVTGWNQVIHRSSVTVPPGEGFIETGPQGNNEHPTNGGRGRGCSFFTTPVPSCTVFSLAGPWQPYSVYVPEGGFDRMTVLLHGGGYPQNYTGMPGVQGDLGEGLGSLLVEPFGRGPGGWYTDHSHLDVLEAMTDALARYPQIDPTRTTIGGISMGGYGTNRLLATNPDLFAGGVLWSAAPGDPGHDYGGSGYDDPLGEGNGDPNTLLENNRNHDVLINHGMSDQAAFYAIILTTAQRLEELGYAYEMWSHPTWQHTTVATLDDYTREAAFLEPLAIDPDPSHVTFTTSESFWAPELSPRLVFDGAYWVDGMRVRDTSAGYRSLGTVDAVTFGDGGQTLRTVPIEPELRTEPDVHIVSGRERVPGDPLETVNVFEATLTNLTTISFDLARMSLGTDAPLSVVITTDGPVDVRLVGAGAVGVSGASSTQDGDDVILHLTDAGRHEVVVG